MISIGLILALTLFPQAQNTNASVPGDQTASDILRVTLKAIAKIDSVEYEVRRTARTPEDQEAKLRTIILATHSPFQFYAKTLDESGQLVALAVSDGQMTRTSAGGKIGENPTFTNDGLMISNMRANDDLSITRELFSHGYLNEAITSRRISLAGEAEIENELCHIIFYARPSPRQGLSMTRYIWVSATTGLPRAVQTLNLTPGQSILSPKLIISKIRLNPPVPPETFIYQPKASDSVAAPPVKPASAETIAKPANAEPPAKPASAETIAKPASAEPIAISASGEAVTKPPSAEPAAIIGKQLPDLELRDVDFKSSRLTISKARRRSLPSGPRGAVHV